MSNNLLKRLISTSLLIPFSIFLIIKGGSIFNSFLIICLILSLFEWNKLVKNKLTKFVGSICICLSFFSAYYLKIIEAQSSVFNFLVILLICIFSDVGGYIFGKIFKGPKITKISPNKTYTGSFGSFFCSVFFLYLCLNFISFLNEYNFDFSIINICLILTLSLSNQIGDLLISFFKRLYNQKDTGHLIPGHGGILDRIDGMIFTFPISLLLIILK